MSKPDVKCPVCKAGPGKSCRSLITGRVTDVHASRWTALYGGFQQRIASPATAPEEQA